MRRVAGRRGKVERKTGDRRSRTCFCSSPTETVLCNERRTGTQATRISGSIRFRHGEKHGCAAGRKRWTGAGGEDRLAGMKTSAKMWMAAVLASGMACGAARADGGPGAEAEAVLAAHVEALCEGDWSKAMYYVDLGALRQLLLETRLAELKRTTPGLSAKDLEEISAVLQTRELAPARMRGIMSDMWEQSGWRGDEGHVEEWRAIPGPGAEAWLARVARGGGKEALVGMRKGEDGWVVAPDIPEKLSMVAQAARGGMRVPAEVPLPEEVAALAEGYWTAWRQGRPEDAWAMMGEGYRKAHPQTEYLARAAAQSARWGVPMAWKLEHCRELRPGVLGLGYALTAKEALQGMLIVAKQDGKWVLNDAQMRLAAPETPRANAGTAGEGKRPFAPDLKPGALKTDLKTTF